MAQNIIDSLNNVQLDPTSNDRITVKRADFGLRNKNRCKSIIHFLFPLYFVLSLFVWLLHHLNIFQPIKGFFFQIMLVLLSLLFTVIFSFSLFRSVQGNL